MQTITDVQAQLYDLSDFLEYTMELTGAEHTEAEIMQRLTIAAAAARGLAADLHSIEKMESAKAKVTDNGKRLAEARGNRTVEAVAEILGCTSESLKAYEAGERIPRDEIKVKLAEIYGKSVPELFF